MQDSIMNTQAPRKQKKLVFETDYWRVGLAEEQTYLGYCVLALKGDRCEDLAKISEEAWQDLYRVIGIFEEALRGAFGTTMFNWTCTMNSAYQLQNPEPHVHWHVHPRYDRPIEFNGQRFEDPNFGHHALLVEECDHKVDEAMQEAIISKIRKQLDV